MTTIEDQSSSSKNLRKQAEKQLLSQEDNGLNNIETMSSEQIKTMLHELQVHQIELEMQNEELRIKQEQLDISRARYFDLYDLAPVGYMTISEKGLIIESNLTVAKQLGATHAKLARQPLSRFIFDEDQDIYYQHRKLLFETQQPQRCELRMMKNSAIPFWVLLEGIVATDDKGNAVCRVVMSDIDELMQAEAEQEKLKDHLNKMQKLESLGLLAGGIAHDFNNVLSGIFGYIEMAMIETKEVKVADYLAESLSSIDRTRSLTQQLLTFAKGGTPIKKVDNLFPFIQKTTEFALSGSSVNCNFQIQENLWSCDFDKNQISQVIENITINAQQAMPNGGTIILSAQNISLSTNEHVSLAPGNYVKLSIKDQGIGIPKDSLTYIFDPYYSTKPEGHGLGLATCYSIVNRHGGCIDVESKPGKGSTFYIYLPASNYSITTKPVKTVKEHKEHTGKGTFLVMDDEPAIRKIIKRWLEPLGYSVVLKENGKDALDFFMTEYKANRTLAGMIFDLTIPGGMGGKETIREIRKIDPNTPAFVASGYSVDPIMADPELYGFNASICKPFMMSELMEMIDKHVKKPE